MKVQLFGRDRVVCEYKGMTEVSLCIVVAYDNDSEAYLVLSRVPNVEYTEDQWSCHWRGDWKSAYGYWSELINDMQVDAMNP